jgi:hypothetical protein
MSAGLQTVHVRINDAATGQPTPVRVHFSTPDGTYFAPLGRLTDFGIGEHEDVGGNLLLGDQRYAYIDGTCEIRLPPGPILLEIHKGPEYTPQFLQTTLPPGKMALRYQVDRWIDLRQEGWYSGDIGATALTPHGALLEAAAEDLAVVNLLAREQTSNVLAFSGQRPALEMPGHLVVVNTCNECHDLGTFALLNCHRMVHPLRLGEPEQWSGWAMADWADQCHRKGGLVVWLQMLGTGKTGPEGRLFGEPLADLLLGKVDALEATTDWHNARTHYYHLLNCGCRLPLTAGARKASNRQQLGSPRTYARLQPGQEFTYQAWIEAVRAGRTFISDGPLVAFTVNGQNPGDVVDLPSLEQSVQVAMSARSLAPFEHLELILNGEVLHRTDSSGSPASASFAGTVVLPAAGWLAARCTGLQPSQGGASNREIIAHTSPIYVYLQGRPPPADGESRAFLLRQLDKMRDWAERESSLGNYGNRRLVEIFQTARQVLAARE